MATRVDKNIQKPVEYYSDFKDTFAKHPLTNELARVTNEDAVKQSLKNLILTDRGERPFQPNLGSDVRRSLFELSTPFAAEDLATNIRDTIEYSEQRVNLLAVNVYESTDQNSFSVNIVFTMVNATTPITLTLILKRVR